MEPEIMQPAVPLFVALVSCVMAVVFLFAFLTLFRPWLRGLTSGVPISVAEILGMRLRGVKPGLVLDLLIRALYSKVPLSREQVERAYLAKVDLERVVDAYILVRKKGKEVTFEQAVDAEQAGRLREFVREREEAAGR